MSLIFGPLMLAFFVVSITLLLIFCRLLLRIAEHFFPPKPDANVPPDPRCPECNYNLRGTIAAERNHCPECGQPFDLPLMH